MIRVKIVLHFARLAKKIETATRAKLQARACLREHAPVLQSARLSQFFFFGQVVKGLLSSWANRGALLWKISKWSEFFF